MSDRDFKEIRKQLRTVVKELLAETIKEELKSQAYKELELKIHAELTKVAGQVKMTLDSVDKRSKDVQDFVLRQSAKNTIVSGG